MTQFSRNQDYQLTPKEVALLKRILRLLAKEEITPKSYHPLDLLSDWVEKIVERLLPPRQPKRQSR